jgi:glycosyltransferase involved in cell wall biosynthesis
MSNFRRPILFSTRLGSISTPMDELFERFNTYGRTVRDATGGEIGELLILGSMPKGDLRKRYEFVDYRYIGSNPIIQLIRLSVILHALPKQRYCFIAGDVWLGGIQIQLLKSVFFKEAKTQVSVHGVPSFASKSILPSAKVAVFRFLLKRVDSIRVVSQSLIPFLTATTHVKENQIFISPIPMSFPKDMVDVAKSIDIVMVGRLHVERGISEATDILKSFLNFDPTRSILIVGDGPLSDEVARWHDSLPEPNSVTLLGHIPNSMVSKKLLASRVLLSCAAEEGYGLALREALICGAFVVARQNSGTQELRAIYPEAVFLFDSQDQARDILKRILAGEFSNFDSQSVMHKQKILDAESLSRLALSWIN